MNPVWCEFWLDSWRGTQRQRGIAHEREAALVLIDPQDTCRDVHVEARPVQTSTAGAGEHIDRVSRHRGEPYRSPAPQQCVVIQFEPLRVRSSLHRRAPRSR